MEGTLIGAVQPGREPGRARGSVQDPRREHVHRRSAGQRVHARGYGAFFYVEIPALDLNLVLTLETLERSAQRRGEPMPVGRSRQRRCRTASVGAATTALRSVAAEDPGQKYRDAVKRGLIDAMLDHSKSMDLGPDEWLTVAARGSESGLIPGEIYQLTTLVLSVKGSDLADFLAGRLTRDEARQKVEVRQF